MESKKANKQKNKQGGGGGGGLYFFPKIKTDGWHYYWTGIKYISLSLSLSPDYLNEEICDIAIENIEDLTRVVISYEIYETSLRRVS